MITASFDDEEAYQKLAMASDVITYEFEHIHTDKLKSLESNGHLIYPSVKSLSIIQNKYTQKKALQESNIPVPKFKTVHNINEIMETGESGSYGYPLMLKSKFGGYDGKGNALISKEEDVNKAFSVLGSGKQNLMVEEFVDFDKEISIIATRGLDGKRVIYPPAENYHKNNILDITIAPAKIDNAITQEAKKIAEDVMEVFDGIGTFCVEMFVTKDNRILVNEVAPRPHNSGHFTIEACVTNQFENHIRAITGLPLGSPNQLTEAVMINLIGTNSGKAKLIGLEEAYIDPLLHVHSYGKQTTAPGRKMGHLTAIGATTCEALKRAKDAAAIIKIIGE
jgi:5-(carboxyamino)imidazole ribonucleotide synthase